jgi:4-diphosphocytidyl-2-C-methyl-D-erythritol kinase
LQIALSQSLGTWKESVLNDFEISLAPKYPIIQDIKNQLYSLGAEYACMTGSGSTVFGIFENTPAIKQAFKEYMVWQGPLE